MQRPVRGVVTLLLLAPITAELLQAYLSDAGGLAGVVSVVVFLAPLYGGAALLIREVAIRTGRGWPGRLLLASAFGVAMPTVIDGSLFTPARSDVADWGAIVHAASFAGVGWFAAISWVAGHVLMSVSAPTIVAEGLAGDSQTWLNRTGLAVVTVGFLALAGFVHHDQDRNYDVHWNVVGVTVSAVLVILLAALAFTPLGRPLTAAPHRRRPPVWACLLFGGAGMVGIDLAPRSWLGVAQAVVVLAVGLGLIAWWSRSPRWSTPQVTALAFGAIAARTATGFFAPLPQGTTWAAKIAQNASLAALVVALGVLLWQRAGRPAASAS